jgi:hypothetical protein
MPAPGSRIADQEAVAEMLGMRTIVIDSGDDSQAGLTNLERG